MFSWNQPVLRTWIQYKYTRISFHNNVLYITKCVELLYTHLELSLNGWTGVRKYIIEQNMFHSARMSREYAAFLGKAQWRY